MRTQQENKKKKKKKKKQEKSTTANSHRAAQIKNSESKSMARHCISPRISKFQMRSSSPHP